MDVGKNTSLGDGGAVKKLVQLLVVADGQLDVAGDDAGLLVVTSGVSGQLENLSGQVLDDGGEVDGGASSDAASVASLLQEAVNASNGELQTGLLGTGLRGGFLSGASAIFRWGKRESSPRLNFVTCVHMSGCVTKNSTEPFPSSSCGGCWEISANHGNVVCDGSSYRYLRYP